MLVWAERSGVLLISVDEIFHADAPMPLGEFYRMELAKRVGSGYGHASDIFRLAIQDRFGGIYADGDDKLVSPDGLQNTFSQYGFAVPFKFETTPVLAARQHPWPRHYLDEIERNYALTQAGLLGLDRVRRKTRADRRQSTDARTGYIWDALLDPYWSSLAVAAIWTDRLEYLPAMTERQITIGQAGSWKPNVQPLTAAVPGSVIVYWPL